MDHTNPVAPSTIPITVSQESVEDDDPGTIVESNAWVVERLRLKGVTDDAISEDALVSYAVRRYSRLRGHGGFLQFVQDTWGNEPLLARLRHGLVAMGAERHLELLDENLAPMQATGLRRIWLSYVDTLKESVGNVTNESRKEKKFRRLQSDENLSLLNARWIFDRPDLQIIARDRLVEVVDGHAERVTGT